MGTAQIVSNALGDFFLHGGLAGLGALLLASILVYGLRKILHGKAADANEQSGEDSARNVEVGEIAEELADDRLMQWYAEQDKIALSEVASSFAWGVPIFAFLSGAITFALAVAIHLRNPIFGLTWIAILAVFISFFLALLRQQTFASTISFATYTAAVSLLWPGLLIAIEPQMAGQGLSLLALVYFAYGSLPIPARFFSVILVVASLVLILGLVELSFWPVVAPIAILIGAASAHAASTAYIDLCWRINSIQLARLSDGIRPGPLLRLLARQLKLTLDTGEALLISESGTGLKSGTGRDVGIKTDPTVVRALLGKLDQLGAEDGQFKPNELGEQFMGPIMDWFGTIPATIHYVKAAAVLGDREERTLLLIPHARGFGLVGRRRLTKAVSNIASLARSIMAIGRHRMLSSDVYVSSARSVSERELELDRLIHSVNNSAQDIAIQCDEIRQSLDNVSIAANDKPVVDKVLTGIKQLETLSRMISAGVSDVKLLRELQKLKGISRLEQVQLPSVIEDLETFCKFRGWRKGFEAEVTQSGCDKFAAKVAGREFFEMGLRMLVKTVGSRLAPNGKIRVRVECEGSSVKFIFFDNGGEVDSSLKARVLDSAVTGNVGIAEVDALRAVNKFAGLSGGTLAFAEAEAGFNNCTVLTLPAVPAAEAKSPVSGQWVLLVDDSLEVTTFYGRVAEAMQLKYFTATSLAEAKKILSDQGRPRLVITDVQLGDGSGVDLVRALRTKYGVELPVIVVSGESDLEVVERIRGAGATKYLTKPVGRKKLFEEIEGIMGGSAVS